MQALAAGDDDTLRRLVPEHLTVFDHRPLVGTEGPVGRDAWLASFRNASELGELLVRLRFDHIPRLSASAGVFVVTLHGAVGGGAFERPAVVVAAHDGSRPRSLEEFDFEQPDAAFARYEELSRDVPAQPRIENAATRAAQRALEAWQARDWERLAGLFRVGFRHMDRRRLVRLELDGDEWLASYRQLVEMTSGLEQEVLATRGERLAMWRARWEGADRSTGPSEIESLAVLEVDGHGDGLALVEFDPDDLDAAYAELDDRYAAGEAAPYARTWAELRRLQALAARDWEQVASFLAPDFVVEDHSPLGWGSLDRTAYLESIRALAALAPDSRLRTHHLWLGDRGALGVHVVLGTHEGGVYEQPRVTVSELDAQGRECRRDVYALDQLEEARARFDAIGASREAVPRDPLAALARPNAATAAMDRLQAAFEARDWVAVRALASEGATFEDRRGHAQVSGDADWWVADLKFVAEAYVEDVRVRRTLVATAGDRVCLERVLWSGGPAEGRVEIEYLALAEVDEGGRLVSGVMFDPEDWRAASRDAWRRWLARDAMAAAVAGPALELIEGFNEHDRARMRAMLADDLAGHDHRLVGTGEVAGADAYLDNVAVLWDLAPDVQLEPRFVLAVERHGVVAVMRVFGTFPEGGFFETYVVNVATAVAHGRVTRIELFEIEAADTALARFAELGDPG